MAEHRSPKPKIGVRFLGGVPIGEEVTGNIMRAIMFGAYYCGYCKLYWDEVLEPLADEGFDVEYVDAMKQPSLAKRYKIKNLPNVVILDGGKVQAKLVGKPNQDEIRRLLKGEAQ